MNIYSVLSFILAGLVFIIGVATSTDNFRSFVDAHAALIVLGGTVAVTAISFQMDRIFMMLKVFYMRVIQGKKVAYATVIQELIRVSEIYRKNPAELEALRSRISDPFLRESIDVLIEDFLGPEEIYELLSLRAKTMFIRYSEDAKKFKAIGKFPPAMGLMGAVLGMIALLQTLGTPGAEDNIGPAMSIALVATLYGIAVANLLILPIAENLADSAREIHLKNKIIVEGIKLICEKKNRILFAEHLNSFLLPQERVDWKAVSRST
ncbi:MAG: MotA/TolQ/ExbB proton channel family protein [Bdellovibrionales bacterium]|nr:MotA/TolQ/ExbB proton channel family protein [Bdellovibrionales bacterium]